MLVVRDTGGSGGRGNATLWFPAAMPEDIRRELEMPKTCEKCGCDYLSFDCEVICFYVEVPLVEAANCLNRSEEEVAAARVKHGLRASDGRRP
jgi:hypothetical protein